MKKVIRSNTDTSDSYTTSQSSINNTIHSTTSEEAILSEVLGVMSGNEPLDYLKMNDKESPVISNNMEENTILFDKKSKKTIGNLHDYFQEVHIDIYEKYREYLKQYLSHVNDKENEEFKKFYELTKIFNDQFRYYLKEIVELVVEEESINKK
jgi:hypothetical protein